MKKGLLGIGIHIRGNIEMGIKGIRDGDGDGNGDVFITFLQKYNLFSIKH